ncbi:premnaspirodiene oxygenase-like [Coffea arabica]|uniref:Premnaspirodiene oxygenase-like n=1 Tax=Coffea arabica TaxID=13443 RepID=A0A6P6TG51_COFAR|nr:cytochrome P450 71D8-like [Coffea arabica]
MQDIFNTGTDTTSIVTEWAMSELMKNPKVMAKVQAEVRQVCKGKKTIEEKDIQKLTYLKMVVKETLRLHPPVPLIPRSNKEIKPRCQRRMCPAITFGLVNVELPLAHLLYHFDWGLPDGMKVDDLDMDESIGITVGRKNDLYLVATAYYPSWNE